MNRFLSSLACAAATCALVVGCSSSNASSGDGGTDAPLICGAKGQACCQALNCNLGLTCDVGTCVNPDQEGDGSTVSPGSDAGTDTDGGMPGNGHDATMDATHDSSVGPTDASKSDAVTDAKTQDAKKDVSPPPVDSGKDAGVDATKEASSSQDAEADATVDGS